MTRPPPSLRYTAPLIRTIGDAIAPRSAGQGRLCIVNYHRILEAPDPLLDSEPTVDTFRWQMDLLADCFNVLPLHEAVTRLNDGSLPPRAVAITFDDGYRSTHDLALPVLRSRSLPATVFVTTGHLHDDSSMWNDIILETIRRHAGGTLDLETLGLGIHSLVTVDERRQAASRLTEQCKYLPPEGRRKVIDLFKARLGKDLRRELMLTPDMVRTLSRSDVEIGGHTVTHPILACLDDEDARREIRDNKLQLETITGRPARLFAYPNGKRNADFDLRHVRMVQEAGYEAAFTTAVGPATRGDDPYQYPRSRPWDSHPFMFAMRLLRWLGGGGA